VPENESVPPEWPLQLSADKFAHECLGMAEHYEALAVASDARDQSEVRN
jgi:hypothetical protein